MKEIIATGIGEKKRSIIKTSKTKSKRSVELMDGLKLMSEYVQSCDEKKPLAMAIQRRFHISCNLARSYLSLLFLLLDNKEGDSVRSRPYMEWSLMNVLFPSSLDCRMSSGLCCRVGRWVWK